MDFKAASDDVPLVPGRVCGTCTMCCKVFKVAAIGKPDGVWCSHCAVGSGCRIYADRPEACRDFFCLWRQDAGLPENWKPSASKFVITRYPANGFIYVQVDPASPQAWRKEPYFSRLISWAGALLPLGKHLLVFVRDQATLVMPTGAVPLGTMSPDDGFVVRRTFTASGPGYEAERVARGGG